MPRFRTRTAAAPWSSVSRPDVRLAGPSFGCASLDAHLAYATGRGYRAIVLDPLLACEGEAAAAAIGEAVRRAGLVPAEVGAWCNPIDRDPARRAAAIAQCQRRLAAAEAAGARCCVTTGGSFNPRDQLGPEDSGPEAFAALVESVRAIVDAVRPVRAAFTLEALPWLLPHSPDSYLDLLAAVDRPGFAVHLDPVNMVNSPQRLFHSGDFIAECIRKLGPRLRSVHVKDAVLRGGRLVHIDSCQPGLGRFDHAALLRGLAALGDADLPLVLEHLDSEAEYDAAAAHLRGVAGGLGLAI